MAKVKKMNKVVESISKTKMQIGKLQEVLKQLEQQKIELENAEIIGIIRRDNISIEELSEIIRSFKASKEENINEEVRQVESDD